MKNDTLDWLAAHHADAVESDDLEMFDFGEIDRRNNWKDPKAAAVEPLASDSAAPADLLRRVLELLAPPRLCKQGAAASALKVVALCWMTDSGGMRRRSQAEIARLIGVTPAALSFAVRQLEDKTGFHAPGQTRVTRRR